MNNSRFPFIFGICAGLLLLVACGTSPITPTETVVALTPTITMMPSPIPTNTPPRTPRPTAISIQRGSPTPTNTAKPTPFPALRTADEAAAFIIKMQGTNGGCELPCWWGITPGKTSREEALQILSPLRNFSQDFELNTYPPIQSHAIYVKEYSNFSVLVDTAISETQPVKRIWVSSIVTNEDQAAHYPASWQRYFLNDLFSRLGKPTEIWLGFGKKGGDGGDTDSKALPYYWELYVYYRDLGLSIQYAGPAIRANSNRACLSFSQLKAMDIFIEQPPVSGPPLEPFSEVRPIQDVTQFSLEEDYKAIKGTEKSGCIESPSKYWTQAGQ